MPGKNRIAGALVACYSALASTARRLLSCHAPAAGAVDWDLEKVQDDVYQREVKRQQAQQMQQPSQQSDRAVCGVPLHIIGILFAAFGGVPCPFSRVTIVLIGSRSCLCH